LPDQVNDCSSPDFEPPNGCAFRSPAFTAASTEAYCFGSPTEMVTSPA
jgi:hypothetical protein